MSSIKKVIRLVMTLILSISLGLALAGCGGSSGGAASSGKAKSTVSESKGNLKIRMLDIGQGDSFLLEKDGKFVLIDAGDVEHREAITQLLRKYKVKELSKVIITHPHADHLGGMNAVFKNFKVDALYDDGMPAGTGT